MSGLLPTLRSMCEEIKKCCLPETELEAFSGKRIVPRCSGVLKEKGRETMHHKAVIACVSWLQQHLLQSKKKKTITEQGRKVVCGTAVLVRQGAAPPQFICLLLIWPVCPIVTSEWLSHRVLAKHFQCRETVFSSQTFIPNGIICGLDCTRNWLETLYYNGIYATVAHLSLENHSVP